MDNNLILGGVYSLNFFPDNFFIYIGDKNEYRYDFIEILSKEISFEKFKQDLLIEINHCINSNDKLNHSNIDKNLFLKNYNGYLGRIDNSLLTQIKNL